MPGEAFNWMIRLKAIEREYRMVRLSMDRLEQQAQDDPHVLPEGLRFRDIDAVSGHLEGTYLVRLFSEFETALRHFLRAQRLRQPTKAEPLINKVRDRVNISTDHTGSVHKVRVYRNTLVHDIDEDAVPVMIREATSYLSTFLSWLQRTW